MNILGPKRLDGESSSDYRQRRRDENKHINQSMKGRLVFESIRFEPLKEGETKEDYPEESILDLGFVVFVKSTAIYKNQKRIHCTRKEKKEIKRKRKMYKKLMGNN